jgi:hypothetical protein
MGDTEELQVTRPKMLGTVRQEQLRAQQQQQDSEGARRGGVLAAVRDHNPLTLRLLHMALTLVYAVVATSFWRMTDCVHVPGVAPGDRVLRSDTRVVCYGRDHMPAFVLAWVCLVVYLAAWPMVSLGYLLWFHVRNPFKVEYQFSHRKSHMAFFCAGDFRWNQYFFRHAVLLLEFALGYVVSRALALELRAVVITEVALGVYLVGLVTVRPYAEAKAWKFPIHVGVVVVAMIIGVLNYVLYSGVEEDREGVRRFAEGVSWLVFALVVGLFLVLLVTGWNHLVLAASKHAGDLEQVGVKSGVRRSVFGSFRWLRNPSLPRARLRRSLRAVAAIVRMGLLAMSPRRAAGGGGDGRAMPGGRAPPAEVAPPGAPDLEDVPLDDLRLDGALEMTTVARRASEVSLPAPAPVPTTGSAPRAGGSGPGPAPAGAAAGGFAVVSTGDLPPVRVPVVPPTARASDSPTGMIVDQLAFANPSRSRPGFQAPHSRGRAQGGGSGGGAGGGTSTNFDGVGPAGSGVERRGAGGAAGPRREPLRVVVQAGARVVAPGSPAARTAFPAQSSRMHRDSPR